MKWLCDTDAWSCCTNSSLSWVKHLPQTTSVLHKSSSLTSATDLFLRELHTCVVRHLWILNTYFPHSLKCVFWIDSVSLSFFLKTPVIFCSVCHAHSKNPAGGSRGGPVVPQPADSDQTLSHKALLQVAAQWLVGVHSGGTTLFIYSLRWTDRNPYWQNASKL